MLQSKTRIVAAAALGILLIGTIAFLRNPDQKINPVRAERGRSPILLIGIDAGSWDTIQKLVDEKKVPNFERLVREGAAGYMSSFLYRELIRGHKDYFSPIVWTSIATGKMPKKHGVEDFILPLPSDVVARMVPDAQNGYAQIELPRLPDDRMDLVVRIKSLHQGKKKVSIYLDSTALQDIEIDSEWNVYRIPIETASTASSNQLQFYYKVEEGLVGRPLAEVNYVRLYDKYGSELLDLNPLREKELYRKGWSIEIPEGRTIASSYHLRAKTLWEILSDYNQRVAVVGWWASWPATKVNGYVASSHVGYHGHRMKRLDGPWLDAIEHLTYPPEYLEDIKKMMFPPESLDDEIRKKFYGIDQCSCIGSTQNEIFRNFYWQDVLFEKLTLDLLKTKGPFDLTAVYFRGVDASGHQFLRFQNPEYLKDCTGCDVAQLPLIVENYYIYMDEVIGRLIDAAPPDTTTVIATDHGQGLQGHKGIHRNNGFIILHGPQIKRHIIQQASVLDVTPTILYLLGLPVAQDMDGKVVLEALQPQFVTERPIALIPTFENRMAESEKREIVDSQANQEELENMKALGYIQ